MSADAPAAVPAVGSGTPLQLLPRAIRVPKRPLIAIVVGWLTSAVPALLLGVIVASLLPEARMPEFPVRGAAAIVLLVGFAPIAETLLMGAALLILLRFVGQATAIAISTIASAALHSLEAPVWGLVVWWPFLVFSTVFVTWRQRSVFAAFAMAAIVHALNNLLPALPIAYPDFFAA